MGFKLYNDDCFNVFPLIPDKSVDAIICDLPYGTTACKWDSILPLDQLWKEYKRILKPDGPIVLTSSQPFTTTLINSNLIDFKYCWVWNKKFPANYPLAKKQPMKIHEDIVVFGKTYYPIMTKRDTPIKKGANKGANVFNKGLERDDYKGKIYTHKYPESIIYFPTRGEETFTPTQKPVALMKYLVETYSKENQTVLDNCMGSGPTGVACELTNRKFIGIEKDPEYFNIAQKRISETQAGGLFFNSNTSNELQSKH